MPLGMEVGLGPGSFVLDGDPAPLPRKGAEPLQFLANVYCGQTAGWIKTAPDMEVGLGPGHIVLDEDSASPQRGTAPNFRPMFIVAKRLYVSGCHLVGGRPQPRRHSVRWGPSSPYPKGSQPPIFGQCSLWIHQGGILIHPGRWTKMPLGIEVGRPRPR